MHDEQGKRDRQVRYGAREGISLAACRRAAETIPAVVRAGWPTAKPKRTNPR
jgi:hypothetical protein